MEWDDLDFSQGFAALHAWNEVERERRVEAIERYERLSDLPPGQRPPMAELAQIAQETRERAPLWMQILQFNPWTVRMVGPEERLEQIGVLLGVVEQVFEVEWGKNSKFKNQHSKLSKRLEGMGEDDFSPLGAIGSGGTSRIFNGQTGMSAPLDTAGAPRLSSCPPEKGDSALPSEFYDPLTTICFYLGIAKSRLSALCLEATGLSILEFLDRVRARDFRAELRARMREDVAAWREQAGQGEDDMDELEWKSSPAQFLKWMRANGRGVSRQRWAWMLGMPTRARLSKAIFLVEGLTLEELELAVASELIKRAVNEDPVPMTMERSALREMFDAPGAEKAELAEDEISIEPQRHRDTENEGGMSEDGTVKGELDSSLDGLGSGEVA